jgi:hypothetical protein
MPEDHPDPQILESFMRDEATRDENRVIVRHLLAGCGECLQVTRRLWSLGETRLADGPRRAAFALHGLAQHLAEAGRGEEAEAAFLAARQRFLLAGLGGEAAAVLLDLALLYQREGRTLEVRRLAGELFPILRTGGLRQGAAVALLFFRDLVETGWATPQGLFALAGYLSSFPLSSLAGEGARG